MNKLASFAKAQPQGLPKPAFLVAARDESRVIKDLLKSLQKQTVPVNFADVYVIVEDPNDPTVKICEKFGATVVVRDDLIKQADGTYLVSPARQRKGFALDIAVRQILQAGKQYDLYFVLDADNVLDPNYLAEMFKSYVAGYDIATGYRALKNPVNLVAIASGLTFAMVNTLENKKRQRRNWNVIFSGTGLFVRGKIVEKWSGWPFHSLTEDYEMSLYANLHGLRTYYNAAAVFYDEQPTDFKQTTRQRVRWIRGYFEARWKYIPKMYRKVLSGRKISNRESLKRDILGVNPIILLAVTLAIVLMIEIISGSGILILLTLLLLYLGLMIFTAIVLHCEKLPISNSLKIKTLFYNPIYLMSYVPCAGEALLRKNVKWDKINHGNKS